MNLFCFLVIYALIGINEAATKPVCEQRIPNFEKIIKKILKKIFFFPNFTFRMIGAMAAI